jgi:hypothetical protein
MLGRAEGQRRIEDAPWTAEDRRALLRVERGDEPVLVETSLGAGLCQLTNISSQGAMLQGAAPRRAGEALSVDLGSGRRLNGVVCWIRDKAFGVRFESEADLAAVLSPAMTAVPGQAPREPRLDIGCKIAVDVDGRRRTARLLDISQGGAKLEFEDGLEGADVLLRLPDMPGLGGTIRWRDGAKVGVAFDDKIGFWDLAGWVARHQQRLSRTTWGTMAMIGAVSAVSGHAAPSTTRANLSVSATVVESCLVSGPSGGGGSASVACSGTSQWSVSQTTETKPAAATSEQAPQQNQTTSWTTVTY